MLWEEGTPGSLLTLIASGLLFPKTFMVCGLISTERRKGGASERLGIFRRVTSKPSPIVAGACNLKLSTSGKRGFSLKI